MGLAETIPPSTSIWEKLFKSTQQLFAMYAADLRLVDWFMKYVNYVTISQESVTDYPAQNYTFIRYYSYFLITINSTPDARDATPDICHVSL